VPGGGAGNLLWPLDCAPATDHVLKGENPISELGFFVIADADTLLAFKLAGMPAAAARDAAAARQLLAQALADPAVGLILITERLAREIAPELDAARSEGRPPLILEIPDFEGPLPEGPSLRERLRTIMGIGR